MNSMDSDITPENIRKQKIVEQLEFYFGDLNLMKDNFLRHFIESSAAGLVPVSLVRKFKRINDLASTIEEIADAVTLLHPSSLRVVKRANQWFIGRAVDRPIPEYTDEFMRSVNERTLVIQGLPLDAKLANILPFLEVFAPVENIEKRLQYGSRRKHLQFCGDLFVTFKTREDAKNINSVTSMWYENCPLTSIFKDDFCILNAENRVRFAAARQDENTYLRNLFVTNEIPFTQNTLIKLILSADISNNKIKRLVKAKWNVAQILRGDDRLSVAIRFWTEDGAKKAFAVTSFEYKDIIITTSLVANRDEEFRILRKMAVELYSKITQDYNIDDNNVANLVLPDGIQPLGFY